MRQSWKTSEVCYRFLTSYIWQGGKALRTETLRFAQNFNVYYEVLVKGEEKGFEDAITIKAEVGRCLFVCKPKRERFDEVRERSENRFRLGKGEIECIALCDTEDRILLSDDEDAKKFARVYGINGKDNIPAFKSM